MYSMKAELYLGGAGTQSLSLPSAGPCVAESVPNDQCGFALYWLFNLSMK